MKAFRGAPILPGHRKTGVLDHVSDPVVQVARETGYDTPGIIVRRIELGDIYKGKKVEIEGNFIWCSAASSPAAYCMISLNAQDNVGGVTFSQGVSISGVPFNRVFVTNPIVQGYPGGTGVLQEWIEVTVARVPLQVSDAKYERGQVHSSASGYYTSADSGTPVTAACYALGVAMLYGDYDCMAFETWLQNCPIHSNEDLHFCIWGPSGGPAVTADDTVLQQGETVILPYVPWNIRFVSEGAAASARLNVFLPGRTTA